MGDMRINGEKFKIFEYDDRQSVFDRYALEKDDEALPSYLYSKKFIVMNKKKNVVEDIRDDIKKLKEEDLNNEDLITNILVKYPGIRKRVIGILWILNKYKGKVKGNIDLKGPVKYLDERGVFSTETRAEMTINDYKKYVEKERKILKGRVERQLNIFSDLEDIEAVDTTAFILEDTNISLDIQVGGASLIDIFDSIDVSSSIPFLELSYRGKMYYKVYTKGPKIPLQWLDQPLPRDEPKEYVKFMIINSKMVPTIKNIEKIYSTGVLFETSTGIPVHKLETNFKVTKDFTEEEFINIITGSLGDRTVFKILSTEQKGIRGLFRTSAINFNPVILADFLNTNPLASKIFFMDEKLQTILSKNKFYFYYDPNHLRSPNVSLGISLTRVPGTPGLTQIRITKARNVEQANILRLILSKIFYLYNSEFEDISRVYLGLFQPDKIGFVASAKQPKEKKTKLRLDQLYKERPDLFRKKGYSTQCQKPFQPYIVPENEVKDVAKKLQTPQKLILYEGTWFACEPREDSDPKSAETNVWPGLKPNTKGDEQYQSEAPFLPCCFKMNQYEKKGSHWRRYYDRETIFGDEQKQEKTTVGYIVGIKKLCEPGRKGELPYLWDKILKLKGYQKVQIGAYAKTEKEFYPVLRYGVHHSPDSFVHCLEQAFNLSYASYSPERRIEQVKNVKSELAKMNFSIAKQNLFTEDRETIIKMLESDTAYIDPEKFVDLLQKKYNCNIFLYSYDAENNPDGQIIIPASSHAYLQREIDEERSTVIVLMYGLKYKPYPYQCELFCQLDVVDGKENKKGIRYSFSKKSMLTKTAIDLFYKCNEVYVANVDGYIPYSPVGGMEN